MKKAVVIGMITFTVVPSAFGLTNYVWQGSPAPSPPFTTWATAAHAIQAAVDAANEGNVVLVTNGVYASDERATSGYDSCNRVVITKSITVCSVTGPDGTIIAGRGPLGSNAVRCIYMTAGFLTGFTLSNGYTRTDGHADLDQSGAGINMYGGDGMASNCMITANTAAYCGGGAFAATLCDCDILNNIATNCGGAALSELSNCRIIGNGAMDDGGGVGIDCLVNNCLIRNNWAETGGGAYLSVLNDSVIVSNHATDGGGIAFSTVNRCDVSYNGASWSGGGLTGGSANNCRIANNSSVYGGGISSGSANNCLFIGNYAFLGGGLYCSSANNCTLTHNNSGMAFGDANNSVVWGNDTNYCSGTQFSFSCTMPLPDGDGNTDADPLFVDDANSNFHLQLGSPCINAGTNGLAPMPFDLDDHPRIIGGTVDMGAYEWPGGLWCSFIAAPTLAALGTPVVFSAMVVGTNTEDLFCRWDFENDNIIDIQGFNSNNPSWTYASIGDYSVQLHISNSAAEISSFIRTNYVSIIPEPATTMILILVFVAGIGRTR